MFRAAMIAATATLFPLASPANAQNPVLAVDLVSMYWAYKDFCGSETEPLSKEEVHGLGVIAGRLGFDMDDSSMVALATSNQTKHIHRWIDMGKFTGCTEARVFLRGIAKKGM
jgi:hypothetical protein